MRGGGSRHSVVFAKPFDARDGIPPLALLLEANNYRSQYRDTGSDISV
jgi:hypothetical protein